MKLTDAVGAFVERQNWIRKTQNTGKAGSQASPSAAGKATGDKVSLSSGAQELNAAQAAMKTDAQDAVSSRERTAKIAKLKDAVQSGAYAPDSAATADALVKAHEDGLV